jgi:hypothetical protein
VMVDELGTYCDAYCVCVLCLCTELFIVLCTMMRTVYIFCGVCCNVYSSMYCDAHCVSVQCFAL